MGLESVPTSEIQNEEGQEKGNISAREVNTSRKNYHKNSGSLLSLDNGLAERRPPSAQNRSRSKLEFQISKSEVKIGQIKAKDENDMM